MTGSNRQEELMESFEKGANPILSIVDNRALSKRLSSVVFSFYKNRHCIRKDLSRLKNISLQYDYRYIAIYLWALREQKRNLLRALDSLQKIDNLRDVKGKQVYELAIQHFNEKGTKKKITPDLFFEKYPRSVLSFNKRGIAVYLYNENYRGVLIDFINNIGGGLGDFLSIQLNVQNRNAVIRQGDVKQWTLPNGTFVISKMMMLSKAEKFIREQTNCYRLIEVIPNLKLKIICPISGEEVQIKIIVPFALVNDNYSGNIYAFYIRQMGISLEEILYVTKVKSERRKYLTHFKLIMDALLARGVWWGDMSPRNILVEESEGRLSYALIDFEKTRIFKNSVSNRKKNEYWRGQVFIEELCVICPIEEVIEVFGDYFNPMDWDLSSQKPAQFDLRPDVKMLLAGRGVKHVSLGECNALDKKILDVRRPRVSSQGHNLYYPGTIGFKVEHYLSSVGDGMAGDYDRKTTEVLLAAREYKVFDKIARVLLQKTRKLEIKLVKIEFSSLVKNGLPSLSHIPKKEIRQLKHTLDDLYANRNNSKFYMLYGV